MSGFICEERLAYGPWAAMERSLARLVQHSGFTDVTIVGGAGDQGADVVGATGGQKWVLQSKYRKSGGMDSVAGREAVRSLGPYDAQVAVAVANTHFTPDAYSYHQATIANGIDLRLWNGDTLLDYFSQLPERSLAYREPRPYQIQAVQSVEQARAGGEKTALVLMATGLGKTMVANELIAAELSRNPAQEVLVLAHTTDLVRQLEQSSWSQLPKQHSTHLWTDGEVPAYKGGVVFATWQSVSSEVTRQSLSGRFGLIVVDEAHHAPSRAYKKLVTDLTPNFLVGLTATPWRGDEQSLDDLFGTPVFSMDIVEGMQQGFLAQVDYRMLTDGIDWTEVALMTERGLTIKDLNRRLLMPDRDISIVELVSNEFKSKSGTRGLVFCRSIAHAEQLQPLFLSQGIRAAVLHSRLPREMRFKNLSSFRAGDIDLLLSVEMLNEGIDVPDVNLVAFMRVTHSRRIFIQQLGRGLRMSPGKSSVRVLDFVADIRRIAAAVSMNRDAASRALGREVVRFQDGRIVKFDDEATESFFDEYLADVADIENLEDGARLKYPDNVLRNGEDW
jgi:superfamily II DNA or RNA helicase